MIRGAFVLAALIGIASLGMNDPAKAADADHPVVVLDTTAGAITLELDRTKAPISVDNFLKYVDKGYYDGVIFHRVISDFMIQGGEMIEANGRIMEKGGTLPPIKNESRNGLSNTRGTIAMARTSNPNSATSQFFINHADNSQKLDKTGGGYAVFGKVIDGMDAVDSIAATKTTGDAQGNVPLKAITIKSAKRKG